MKTMFFKKIERPLTSVEGVCHTRADHPSEEVWFMPADIDENTERELREEIAGWEFVDTYRNVHEDLAYDDRSVSKGERIITDDLLVSFLEGSYVSNQVKGGYLIEDGHFAGVILAIENTSSFGMSVNKSFDFGVLFTDGRKAGRTSYHYFHSSTEISEQEYSDYSLRPKKG